VSHAGEEGTARFAARFPAQAAAGFYRRAQEWTVSNIGIGTYLGEMDQATDEAYSGALQEAAGAGINFIDTSLNYRNQRSERNIAQALRALIQRGALQREEVVVCTKAGYLVPDAIPADRLTVQDVAGGVHSMATAFLDDQLDRSRKNLGLDAVDVFYLHNPETQLASIREDEFYERIRRAFEFLEGAVSQGKIRYYGAATWDGFRRKPKGPAGLSLDRLADLAQQTGGNQHHFRFIQLPFNLAMPEAFTQMENEKSVLTRAADLGITVIASASLLQGRLKNLPEDLAAKLAGVTTDAQRCIQFTRSTPGIAVALVGMSRGEHVRENAALSRAPTVALDQYLSIYRSQ